MANSAAVRTSLAALTQTHYSSLLRNTIFDRLVLLYFLLGKDGDKKGPDGLGVPGTGMVMSGVDIPKAKRESILGSTIYQPLIQTSAPALADGKALTQRDTMPVRNNADTATTPAMFTRPAFKWVEWADPYQIWNKDIRRTTRTAKNEVAGWEGVVSLFQAETKSVLAQHLTRWNKMFWGTTGPGAPTDETAEVWDYPHSLQNALHTTNTYGGVDRTLTANAYWKGNRVTAAQAADFESLINYCNYDLGLSKKGTGIDLLLMDGPNFKAAKSEAKAKDGTGVVYQPGTIPEFGKFGYKRELVKIDNTWIAYDPECPTGHVAALNLSTWTVAVSPDANFVISPPQDQSKIKGGEDAQTGTARTELMACCEVPSLNCYFTNVGQ